MKKIFFSVIIVLILLVIVAGVVVGLNLDRIVKKSVEIYGPQIVKVPIGLDAVHIALLTGSARIEGLVVGNPEGYKTPHAMTVGKISVGVNPASLLSDKIVVRSIKVESPEITFEGGFGGNNLTAIKNNVSGTAQKGGPVVTNSVGQPKPAKKLEVDEFVITGAKVSGTLALFGKDITVKNLPLPPIHLTNLGKGSNGITATDLTKQVVDEITITTIQALGKYASNLGSGAVNLGSTNVNRIKQGIGNLFHK
ncbi:MAG TPA: AsmA family protein [Methylomirabilota bacterium]|nr:AsmA family protein [Methylomirabilota bacterium]